MLVQELRSVRAALAGLDVAMLTVSDAAALLPELASLKKACAAAEARTACRAGQSAEDLALQGGMSVGAARAAIETVAALDQCPDTAAALSAGEVSLEQAHEITRTEEARPGSEEELLALAYNSGLKSLKEQARRRRHQAIGIDEVHRRRVAARSIRHWTNELGNIAFAGELPPETGVPFVNRLEAETDRLRREAKKGADPLESRDAYRADALVRMFSTSGAAKRAPSTELVLVLDYVAALRGELRDGEMSHIIGGDDIPVDLAKTLSKDALVKFVIHDGVNPLRIKSFGRYRPAELDAVLRLGPAPQFRGLTCVDCGARGHLQWDHVDPVANWGPTSYDNLEPRCWTCHGEKTQRDRKAGLLDGRSPPRCGSAS